MKMLLFLGCFTLFKSLNGQSLFISEGKIIFERKIDLSKELIFQWKYKGQMDKIPKYHTSQHILLFSGNKTLFEKGEDISEKNQYYEGDQHDDDIVYTDLNKCLFTKKQSVFEEIILLSDSIRNIHWEMTNDTRVIAGFECHKATAIILDSIFVVAFYADEFTVSGGPMSFCKLPGMILGIAIPRMNLTIFATKVDLNQIQREKISPPSGKPKLNNKEFSEFLISLGKRRFDEIESRRYLIKSLL